MTSSFDSHPFRNATFTQHAYTPAEINGIGVTSQRVRDRMVALLHADGISDADVLSLMAYAPRHLFVENAFSHHAYRSDSLPIGFNQTLSKPWIVARMSELVHREEPRRVLEVGTGSGFQTYLLAHLCREVFSIERIHALSKKAEGRLRRLDIRNVRQCTGDGRYGWQAHAPYDAIVVTACTAEIYPEWIHQLADGGVVIAPLQTEFSHEQRLVLARKNASSIHLQQLEAVRFVPLIEGVLR
ncbi:Protein-L-isoaspartate O-methyltransferase [Halomonadaceae bacterium LMG 33818]|uniref:protein-L-isoaspartate(D-aspartate) O-methyltransferase n=1 Tax=Cernens ardua TaxID=3402176 RepID=UPI003EDC0920